MEFTCGRQVGLREFGHEPRPTLRASLFFLLFLNFPLTSAIVAVFKIVVRFWWRHTHVLPGKGLPKGKVENERSHGGSHRIFTLYCGKSRGTERKGKGREAHGPFGEHLPGNGLLIYIFISLPIPSTLICCCFCGLTDRSLFEKLHSVSRIIGQNPSDSKSKLVTCCDIPVSSLLIEDGFLRFVSNDQYLSRRLGISTSLSVTSKQLDLHHLPPFVRAFCCLLSIWTFELPTLFHRNIFDIACLNMQSMYTFHYLAPPNNAGRFLKWNWGPWNWSPLCGMIVPKRRPVRRLINSGAPVNGLQDTHVCAQANLRKIQSLPGGILRYVPALHDL
jgi:hypothetical protein